ncbi:hypothetical protein J31TS4_38750 [Paenibacillus sp. J31TS4]|nr:hypothetical protein J31TS4_38750 [Paenibacillus sp. J31TS4]
MNRFKIDLIQLIKDNQFDINELYFKNESPDSGALIFRLGDDTVSLIISEGEELECCR